MLPSRAIKKGENAGMLRDCRYAWARRGRGGGPRFREHQATGLVWDGKSSGLMARPMRGRRHLRPQTERTKAMKTKLIMLLAVPLLLTFAGCKENKPTAETTSQNQTAPKAPANTGSTQPSGTTQTAPSGGTEGTQPQPSPTPAPAQ